MLYKLRLSAVPGDRLARVEGVRSARPDGAGWRLVVEGLPRALPALPAAVGEAGATPVRLATHHATLEDVFVSLTGRTLRDE